MATRVPHDTCNTRAAARCLKHLARTGHKSEVSALRAILTTLDSSSSGGEADDVETIAAGLTPRDLSEKKKKNNFAKR